jgi:hypothetical protein
MEMYNIVKKLIENEEISDFLDKNPEYSRTVMHIIINETDNVKMANVVLEYFKKGYKYIPFVKRFLDEPDYHINFNINNVRPKMKEWLIANRDIFLKPFTIIRVSRNHDYIIQTDIYNL